MRVEVLAVDLGDALAGAHHAGGVDRLVGGDQHEALDPDFAGRIGHRARAQHVVAERRAQLPLQHRHVLVGRSMEHDLRLRIRERLLHGGLVAAVGEDAVEDQLGEIRTQFLVDPVQVVFALFDHRERLRTEPGDLPAQFRADRTRRRR